MSNEQPTFFAPQAQVDVLISQVRAEKYFEAHGIRTPLPAARAAPAPAEAEFEFVDDDMAPRPAKFESGMLKSHSPSFTRSTHPKPYTLNPKP